MSNESENKRIDLTQFEGMTKGPWRWDNDDYGAYVFTDNGEDGLQIASIESGEDNDASAIAKLPDLIAELKRCYAREDELLDALRIIRDDLDEEIAKAHFPSDKVAWQIRNFAHDASQ